MAPHSAAKLAHVFGVQPHRLGSPPPLQVPGAEQLPQSSIDPQPSGIDPQSVPCMVQVVGLHPHWLAVPPPPQVLGKVHAPQSRSLPH
jgi:hypothetical protein